MPITQFGLWVPDPLRMATGPRGGIAAGLMFTGMLLGLWLLQKTIGRDLRFVTSAANAPILALVGVWALALIASDVDVSPMVWLWGSYTLPRLGQLAIVIFSATAFLLALNFG